MQIKEDILEGQPIQLYSPRLLVGQSGTHYPNSLLKEIVSDEYDQMIHTFFPPAYRYKQFLRLHVAQQVQKAIRKSCSLSLKYIGVYKYICRKKWSHLTSTTIFVQPPLSLSWIIAIVDKLRSLLLPLYSIFSTEKSKLSS